MVPFMVVNSANMGPKMMNRMKSGAGKMLWATTASERPAVSATGSTPVATMATPQ